MAKEIIMPKLGATMTEGTITEWFKDVGEYVEKGDILFSFETDKIMRDFESSDSGYVLNHLVKTGESAAVLQPICLLGEKDEIV